MTTIGLTGGVGSGKSTVARMLAARGALVVDADAIAREVVAPGTPALADIVARFGPEVIQPDGTLNRAALAAVVFSDDDARAALNHITHPRIAAHTAHIVASAAPGQVVVHDVPLLAENNLAPDYDLVVVVEAPEPIRLERLESRGMPEAEAVRRMASQATDEQRREVADVVLSNVGDLASLQRQVDVLWDSRISLLR